MPNRDIVLKAGQLQQQVPALFLDAGPKSGWRVLEFFTARIRNKNTREAYGRAVGQFSDWCARHKLVLASLNAVVISAYVEELSQRASPPTVKQHLAAIRMLFDYLVTGQIVPANPAAAVKGPKWVVKKGKTPVLTAEEARALLDRIDVTTVGGLRDRGLIAVMVYSFARVGAVVAMDVEDYFQQGRRSWFRLHEKGGKRHDVPAHHTAEAYMDEYLAAVGTAHGLSPLFRSLDRRRELTPNRLDRREALAVIKRRAKATGLPPTICCHSFRATGITAYLLAGGTLEHAQRIASHESPTTTKLYDRTNDAVSLDEIEKILI